MSESAAKIKFFFGSVTLSRTFVCNFIERVSVAFQRCSLSRGCLPALDHDVHVFRIELNAVTNTVSQFRGRERCPASQERLFHLRVGPFIAPDLDLGWTSHDPVSSAGRRVCI